MPKRDDCRREDPIAKRPEFKKRLKEAELAYQVRDKRSIGEELTPEEEDIYLLDVARRTEQALSKRDPNAKSPARAPLLTRRTKHDSTDEQKLDRLRRECAEFNGPPTLGPHGDLRTMAQVLALLQHATPLRDAFLEGVGIPPSALSVRVCDRLSHGILEDLDRTEASGIWDIPWEKLEIDRQERRPRQGINTRRLSDVLAHEVEWQWPGVTALGKLTLFSGNPGVGKTWLALDIIARLTTGRPFPLQANPPNVDRKFPKGELLVGGSIRRNALFISAEDADEDTVKPRIELLGGDSTRIHTLDFIFENRNRRTLSLADHINYLDKWLFSEPMVELVVIDPLTAFLGKTDSHKNADVRAVLEPLSKVAEKRRVAIIGVNHLTKGTEGSAVHRSMGSIGFMAAARVAWQVTADPDEPDRSLMLPVKVNIGKTPRGLAFRLSETTGIEWEQESIDLTADEALNGPRESKLDDAKDFLRNLLREGPMPATAVEDAAAKARIFGSTLKTAKRQLGIKSEKSPAPNGGWEWRLPERR